jgi:phenylalanyl-tRNA synthetase alpha chain
MTGKAAESNVGQIHAAESSLSCRAIDSRLKQEDTYIEQVVEIPRLELLKISNILVLEAWYQNNLSKHSNINIMLSAIKNLVLADKKRYGMLLNKCKKQLTEAFIVKKTQLEQQAISFHPPIDVSLSYSHNTGSLHPITITQQLLLRFLSTLGFTQADGPEIETDYYNFDVLNIPLFHPARAMQDTFYTYNNNVLRTHTSNVQVRYANCQQPPFKLMSTGSVYRVDMDSTHSPMFHQLELLWVEKYLNFAQLKALMTELLQNFFANSSLELRFRASFFPFTEPSAEIDILLQGKWLEVGGCGIVHHNVLDNMKINNSSHTGIACGLGIERLAMLKFGITDLRVLFENRIEFLQQFSHITTSIH